MRFRYLFGACVLAAGAGLPLVLGSSPDTPAASASESSRVVVELRSPAALSAVLAELHLAANDLRGRWSGSFTGFAATIPVRELTALRTNPLVIAVEPDATLHVSASKPGSWGLDRVDQRTLPLDKVFAPAGDGAGVTAYVIDTGIKTTNRDFGTRASIGIDFAGGGPIDDCHGHGTHVAGTIGGTKYGIAKKVALVGVRVMDCNGSGPTSAIINGIDWVRAHHVAGRPAVANLSLGGARSTVLDSAVRALISSGVTVVVAAGNGDMYGQAQSACSISPARVKEAITVSAVDSSDRKAEWAGYGSCVDLFAPGVDITSDWKSSSSSTKTLSGTSMAAPHAAGAAAVVLSLHPDYTPAQVADVLVAQASASVVKSSRTTKPRLLYIGVAQEGGGYTW